MADIEQAPELPEQDEPIDYSEPEDLDARFERGEYDDFVGPPIESDAIPGPLGHNYPPATLPRAEYAEKILLHYFKTVWDAAGLPWNSDNEVEIVGAIEDIVKAARA